MLRIWPIEVFSDNYVWVLEREGSARVAVVDPGDGPSVVDALEARRLEAAVVLLTHHHHDHVGGLADVVARFHPAVHGSGADGLPGVDCAVGDGDTVEIDDLDLALEVVALPGHTANHLGFIAPGFALVGDTLFAGGCGRVFDGTMAQMHDSLSRLASLPAETKAYCAHEYTLANLRFALKIEPDNEALAARLAAAEMARAEAHPTVPSTIGDELATNPFLRCSVPTVVAAARRRAGREVVPGAETFAVLRRWKDGWSG